MTITVRLPATLEADLRVYLGKRGMNLSVFVRDAIVEKLERERADKPSAYALGKDLFGKYGSGRRELSSGRKVMLNEMLRASRHR
jgi:hypothetical protein